jgi:hypothetical protein
VRSAQTGSRTRAMASISKDLVGKLPIDRRDSNASLLGDHLHRNIGSELGEEIGSGCEALPGVLERETLPNPEFGTTRDLVHRRSSLRRGCGRVTDPFVTLVGETARRSELRDCPSSRPRRLRASPAIAPGC